MDSKFSIILSTALFVNENISISSGLIFSTVIKCSTLYSSVSVFPEPGPAMTFIVDAGSYDLCITFH